MKFEPDIIFLTNGARSTEFEPVLPSSLVNVHTYCFEQG